jgi:hypothetical protein
MVNEHEPDAGADAAAVAAGPTEATPGPRADLEATLREQQEAHREAVARLEARADALQRAYRGAIKERELATALAGRPLVAGGASQLIRLLRDEVDVVEEDGRFRVVTRDGRPLARAMADWLASEEYAHFCRPSPRVGTAVPGVGVQRAAAAPAAAPPPRTLGEAAVQSWRESSSQQQAAGGSRPIGLHRRRP